MESKTASQIVSLFAERHVGKAWFTISPKQAGWLLGQARREGLTEHRSRSHRYGQGAGSATSFTVARGQLADGTAWIASDGNLTIRLGQDAERSDW